MLVSKNPSSSDIEFLNMKKHPQIRFYSHKVFCHSAFTMFVAITFPFFDGLLGFFGGFAFAPTTYFVSLIRPSKNKNEKL